MGGDDHRTSRILVVEDDRAAREALAALLVDAGYEVTTASDGALALETLEVADPDLIITDLAMPAMNGFEVIKAVRLQNAQSEVPVIIVSANDQSKERVRGLDIGADDFLAKPIDFDELLARIRRQLSRARRHRVLERESSADALTGVFNRRRIMEVLAHELHALNEGQHLAVIMIDVDDFKAINDTYGHLAGDLALCAVARTLEEAVRETDKVSRLGGDEFLIVAPALDEAGQLLVIERLRALLPIDIAVSSTVTFHLSLSFGCASAVPGDTVRCLLERADSAMYSAKRARK